MPTPESRKPAVMVELEAAITNFVADAKDYAHLQLSGSNTVYDFSHIRVRSPNSVGQSVLIDFAARKLAPPSQVVDADVQIAYDQALRTFAFRKASLLYDNGTGVIIDEPIDNTERGAIHKRSWTATLENGHIKTVDADTNPYGGHITTGEATEFVRASGIPLPADGPRRTSNDFAHLYAGSRERRETNYVLQPLLDDSGRHVLVSDSILDINQRLGPTIDPDDSLPEKLRLNPQDEVWKSRTRPGSGYVEELSVSVIDNAEHPTIMNEAVLIQNQRNGALVLKHLLGYELDGEPIADFIHSPPYKSVKNLVPTLELIRSLSEPLNKLMFGDS